MAVWQIRFLKKVLSYVTLTVLDQIVKISFTCIVELINKEASQRSKPRNLGFREVS